MTSPRCSICSHNCPVLLPQACQSGSCPLWRARFGEHWARDPAAHDRQSLRKPLKKAVKGNCVLIKCGSVDQVAYAKRFHGLAHARGACTHQGAAAGGRWSAARLIAYVTAKLQDVAKQSVHSADRGIAPSPHAVKWQQRRQGEQDDNAGRV